MPDDLKTPRWLVIVSANPATPARLAQIVPALLSTLDRMAEGPVEQAFRSLHADHFGFLMRSRHKAHQINDTLRTPAKGSAWFGGEGWVEPFLTNADQIMVLEIGDQFGGSTGFSRAFTWLQRH